MSNDDSKQALRAISTDFRSLGLIRYDAFKVVRGALRSIMRCVAGTVLALATTFAGPAFANDYPNRPIKVISDSAPGSAVDVTFRMVMDRLGTAVGQRIIPVDQPGAGGAIAAHAASESIPDGYTLFAPALSLFISLSGKAENLPLILPRDFLPVGSLAQLSVFICASLQSGIKTLPELIARAKERPGEVSFAATGIGRITHLTGLLLESRAGIKLEAVPYAGGPAAALTDVIGGRVPLIIEGYSGLAGVMCWPLHRRIACPIFRICQQSPRLCRASPPADGRASWRRLARPRAPYRRSTKA
jgi:tripartite-type tricarboxylate transporter receptor subunit TctC